MFGGEGPIEGSQRLRPGVLGFCGGDRWPTRAAHHENPCLTVCTCEPILPAMPSAASLEVGATGVVEDVEGSDATALRLLEMGLVPGTPITLIKRAPGGDPVQLRVRGFHLSLRIAEAGRVRLSEPTA